MPTHTYAYTHSTHMLLLQRCQPAQCKSHLQKHKIWAANADLDYFQTLLHMYTFFILGMGILNFLYTTYAKSTAFFTMYLVYGNHMKE